MDGTDSQSLFDEFMPHGMCYMWRQDILLLNVVSDILIAAAYFSIPFFLYYFFNRRPNMPFRNVIGMFTIFIFSCGVTHLIGVWNVWHGNYGIQGIAKAVTATASVATALMLIPVMPQLMALRSPIELEKANDALQNEVQERKKSETKRRSLEKQSRQLEQEIAHIGRINTMGQMATGLAHELNQPLTAIMQNSDSALIELRKSDFEVDELRDILKDLEAQAFRAGEIIKALRQFVRKDDDGVTEFDLNKLIQQTLQLFDNDIKKFGVHITSNLNSIPRVTWARVQIAQLIVNLVQNSINAVLENKVKHPSIIVSSSYDAGNVTVTVEDNGIGIPDKLDLFMPFVSSSSEGLGMGLSICRTIVDMHEGNIWYDEESDLTTRVGFTLPVDK